jgi:hypothetical protein
MKEKILDRTEAQHNWATSLDLDKENAEISMFRSTVYLFFYDPMSDKIDHGRKRLLK